MRTWHRRARPESTAGRSPARMSESVMRRDHAKPPPDYEGYVRARRRAEEKQMEYRCESGSTPQQTGCSKVIEEYGWSNADTVRMCSVHRRCQGLFSTRMREPDN